MRAILNAHVDRFRDGIARRMGLAFEDAKAAWLADVLGRRLASTGKTAEAYLSDLDASASRTEIGALASELTVSETYFFRNHEQYAALIEEALPSRQSASRGPIHILSAGCATGEEPYTLAALLHDADDRSLPASIVGVDINPVALAKARAARYSAWSLRETPPAVRQQWFTPDGRDFILDERLRRAVRFEERNLADPDPSLWPPGTYDVVFFRNVLMYFTREVAEAVIARIAGALKPGGYLFLGHAETLRGLSGDFHLQHTHDTFYYRRRDHHDASRASMATAPSRGWFGSAPAADSADSWIEAIGQATQRIQTLTGADRLHPHAQPPLATPTWDLGSARGLLREERFADALEMLHALPPESADDPDVLLLRAALQTHSGLLAEAEDACRRLLDVDELSAGAHYLLALCRDGAGDRAGAESHDQTAIYLDPGFAMPHLHLGLLARRAGDPIAAQRELAHALVLLQREDASRLLLFGGGFSRETLVALCRTELAGCRKPVAVESRPA